jgi:hypothetical protein
VKRGALPAVLATVGMAGFVPAACIDLSTDPDEIVAIEFVAPRWPSVVAGDTLRDATGAIVPLEARLFGGDGDEVFGAPVDFLPEDDRVVVAPGGFLVADEGATGAAVLFASVPGVQSLTRQVEIVERPDSLAPEGSPPPLEWVIPDDPSTNTSAPLGGRVLSVTDTDTSGVRAWIVTFELESAGALIAPSDTSGVFLVSESGRPSYADTTDATGRATRRVRVRITPGFTPPDSVIVTVRTSYRGAQLAGSPVRLVLPPRPR